MGGADGLSGSVGSILGISPSTIAGVIETLEASGVDISGMLNSVGHRPTGAATAAPTAKIDAVHNGTG